MIDTERNVANFMKLLNLRIIALCLAQFANGQPATTAPLAATASLSGRVAAEDGHAVRATVVLSFAGARGYPSPPRRAITGTNGAFAFSKLPPGKYAICAQVAATEAAPANAPFIDTCSWGSSQAPVIVTAGQQVTGVVFTAPKGAWLNVSVADPDHVLPAAVSKAPAPLEPQLQLMVKGPDGLYRHARFLSATAAGRNYQMAIPLNTALAVKVTSNIANVFDQNGNQVQETVESAFQSATAVGAPAAASPPTAFTLHAK